MRKAMKSLQTPVLIVERKKFVQNCHRVLDHIARNNLSLRIHGKTCKSIDALKECCGGLPASITASTLDECEYYFNNGIQDIIYAVGMAPQKIQRVASLQKRGARIKILLDNMETANLLATARKIYDCQFNVMIEIDCDGHRSGLMPSDPELLGCAQIITQNGNHLAGVLTHAGSAYELSDPTTDNFKILAEQETNAALQAASLLKKAGFPCPITSVGSTPTAIFGENWSGITEIRAGVFMFMDCVMVALNVCKPEDIALSVLCTVIGVRKKNEILIVDAGWSALSSDKGKEGNIFGYGIVCNLEGDIIPDLHLVSLNQEHGIIKNLSGRSLTPGTMLRILPQHACATAHNFNKYVLYENNQFINIWQRSGNS